MSDFYPLCTFRVNNQSDVKFTANDVSHAEAGCKYIQKPKTIFPKSNTVAGIYQATGPIPESISMSVYRIDETRLLLLLASFRGISSTKMAVWPAIGSVIDRELVFKIWLDSTYTDELSPFVVGNQPISGNSRFVQLEGGSEANFDLFPIFSQGPGQEISPPTSARCNFGVDNQSLVSFAPFATTPSAEWLGKCTEAPQDIKANAISSAGKFATAEYNAGTIAMAVYHVGSDSGNDKFLLLLASFGGKEPGATKASIHQLMTIRQNPYCVRVNPKFVLDIWTDPTVTATLEPVIVHDVPVGERIAGTSCFRQLENGDSAADFVIRPSLLSVDAFISPFNCGFKVQNETQVTFDLYANPTAVFAGKCIVQPKSIIADVITPAGVYQTPSGIQDRCIAATIYHIKLSRPGIPLLLLLLASFPGDQPATKASFSWLLRRTYLIISAQVALIPAFGQSISSELVQEVWADPQWTSETGPIETTQGRISITSTWERLFGGAEANFLIEYNLIEKE